MSSESHPSLSAFIERLIPLFSSITTTRPDSDNPDHNSTNHPLPNRILLINPLTQRIVVIGPASGEFTKHGQPPASEASIDGLPTTEIKCTEDVENLGGECECVICLEEMKIGDVASEMPCKHKFHGGCVKKWLRIHGSCPVCRFMMPGDDSEKKIGGERVGRSGGVWVTIAVGRSSSDEESSMEA